MQPHHHQSYFPKVDSAYNFPALEQRILELWEKEHIFEKSLEKPAPEGSFVFYEGPPTANNLPHIGHVLTRVVKDLFPRYRTMRGHRVQRKAGWDTHGLPVELAIEKKLGFQGKDAIEAYGVAAFNQQCYENVRVYEREWARTSKRIGFWLNYDDAYFTFTNTYIESVWWLLSQLFERGLLYRGYKVLPYCPLCGTTLSSHEVAQNYKDVKDPSVTIKFRVKAGQRLQNADGAHLEADGQLYLLAWTTTPWTLPSNVALAVHPDHVYKVVRSKAHQEQCFILAAGLEVPAEEPLVGADGKPTSWDLRSGETLFTLTGKELDGLEYERLFDYAGEVPEKGWYVATADYVTLTDGTGIVHTAPAYGAEDYGTAQRRLLPFVQMVNSKGVFVDEAGPYKGMWFKDADPEIIAELKHRGLLLRSQKLEHPYPHCWRHDTPLFYNANSSWFIKSTAVKEQLLHNNQQIAWQPEHIRSGRFGNWLENVIDWAISRKRYWGTPLPIWVCPTCGEVECIGSYAQLYERMGKPMPENVYDTAQFNPHRPFVDELTWTCSRCNQGQMKRVEEVIDCWFDSGAMPFAQHHYPFENKDLIDRGEQYPADFISEAIDQTRGWFYTLHAISTLIMGKPAYKNCLVLGHIQDEQGRKMSKSLGNVVDPRVVLETLGADCIRWYFYANVSLGQSSRFSERLVRESAKNFLLPLWNAYSFFTIYANIDGWKPGQTPVPFAERELLDRWILTRLQRLVSTVTAELDAFHLMEGARALEAFVDDLNNWYIRRSRRRFWSDEQPASKESAYQTLYQVLTTLTRLIAPFTPFVAEELYQALERPFGGLESVHLADYPRFNAAEVDEGVEQAMAAVTRVVSLGHAARNLSQVKVRQPLSTLTVVTLDESLTAMLTPYLPLVLDELNVKALHFARERDAFVRYVVKPNFRKLGPRVGKQMPKVKAAVETMDPAALARSLEQHGYAEVELDGRLERFSGEELEISIQQKEGTTTASDEGLLVVLDTTITTALKLEGLTREVISRVQGLRKDLNLEYTARIRLEVEAGPALSEALETQRAYLSEETLALSLTLGPLTGDAPVQVDEVLDDQPLRIRLLTA